MAYTEIGLHIANNQQSPECAVPMQCVVQNRAFVSSHISKLSQKFHMAAPGPPSVAAPQILGRGLIPP